MTSTPLETTRLRRRKKGRVLIGLRKKRKSQASEASSINTSSRWSPRTTRSSRLTASLSRKSIGPSPSQSQKTVIQRTAAAIVKRQRSRPRETPVEPSPMKKNKAVCKNLIGANSISSIKPDSPSPPVKKDGRGRPRKYPLTALRPTAASDENTTLREVKIELTLDPMLDEFQPHIASIETERVKEKKSPVVFPGDDVELAKETEITATQSPATKSKSRTRRKKLPVAIPDSDYNIHKFTDNSLTKRNYSNLAGRGKSRSRGSGRGRSRGRKSTLSPQSLSGFADPTLSVPLSSKVKKGTPTFQLMPSHHPPPNSLFSLMPPTLQPSSTVSSLCRAIESAPVDGCSVASDLDISRPMFGMNASIGLPSVISPSGNQLASPGGSQLDKMESMVSSVTQSKIPNLTESMTADVNDKQQFPVQNKTERPTRDGRDEKTHSDRVPETGQSLIAKLVNEDDETEDALVKSIESKSDPPQPNSHDHGEQTPACMVSALPHTQEETQHREPNYADDPQSEGDASNLSDQIAKGKLVNTALTLDCTDESKSPTSQIETVEPIIDAGSTKKEVRKPVIAEDDTFELTAYDINATSKLEEKQSAEDLNTQPGTTPDNLLEEQEVPSADIETGKHDDGTEDVDTGDSKLVAGAEPEAKADMAATEDDSHSVTTNQRPTSPNGRWSLEHASPLEFCNVNE